MSGGEPHAGMKAYAPRVIRLVETLPAARTADAIDQRLLRPATSGGATGRATRLPRCPTGFITAMKLGEGEVAERPCRLEPLCESDAPVAMAVASIGTACGNNV